MAGWLFVLLVIISSAFVLAGFAGLAVVGLQWVSERVRKRMPLVIGPIRIGKPPPIVLTPGPAVIHIDRTPAQMAHYMFNKTKHRVSRSWRRLRHGL